MKQTNRHPFLPVSFGTLIFTIAMYVTAQIFEGVALLPLGPACQDADRSCSLA
jgi:hypothetical protein